MYQFYMGMWWFCFIQWPLFRFYLWASDHHLVSCFNTITFICKYSGLYVAYMVIFAAFMPLPIILTIILAIRARKGKAISKLEKALAIGSWILSLYVIVRYYIIAGGPHS